MFEALFSDMSRLIVLAGLGAAGVLSVMIWVRNRTMRVSFLRFIIQIVSLFALFYLFSIKPSIPLLYVLVGWFVASLFLGRFFCGWICPFAFLMDVENVVRKTLKIRHRPLPVELNTALHKGRYIILGMFLFLPIILWLLRPPSNLAVAVVMAQRLAGPFRSYSLIIEPLVPFIVPWIGQLKLGSLNFSYPYIGDITTFISATPGQIFAVIFVAVTLIGAFFVRRVWCRFCPAGASIASLNQFKIFRKLPFLYIDKDEEKCTKCGVCKRVCPVQVNEVYEQKGGKINTSQCMLCARCVEMCPYEDALKVKLVNKSVFKSRNWLEPSNNEQKREERKVEVVKTKNTTFALGLICIILISSFTTVVFIDQQNRTALEEQIFDFSSQIADLQNQVNNLNSEISNYEAQISDYQDQIASLTDKLNNYTNIIDLKESHILLNNTTYTQNATTATTIFNETVAYAGYMEIQVNSTSTTTYTQVSYKYNELIFNQTITTGTNATAYFPVLPGTIKIQICNTDTQTTETTITLTYIY
ncbi:MAG: 4Fe-4S binding protein [Candidatus Bathyarchaeota archaeon]|nr:4Fe-4S binding protein [Candidatus Termiticorpusculum sp.]